MRYKMKDGKLMGISDSFKASKDDMTHTHEDGTTHSHEGGDKPHTHDKETPNFGKMTKKALGDWAKENNISVDSKKTKAGMIEEIKGQL